MTRYYGRYYSRRDAEFYRQLIENMGSDAISAFTSALLRSHTVLRNRVSGWDILEGMGDRGITQPIKESLHSRDLRIREAAVFHLRQMDSVMSRSLLEELLGDESALIRYHIVMALQNHPVSPATKRALKELGESDPTKSVREAAQAVQ